MSSGPGVGGGGMSPVVYNYRTVYTITIYRVRAKLFPSIWRVLVSGVWVEMKVFIFKVGWFNGVGLR